MKHMLLLALVSLAAGSEAWAADQQQSTYTLPASYYNSLSDEEKQALQQNNQNTAPQASVTVNTAPVADQQNQNAAAQEEVPVEQEAPLAAQDQVQDQEKKDEEDYSSSPLVLSDIYIDTELGALRAEIEELKKKHKDSTAKVGYEGRFFLESEDGNYQLNIAARFQFRYSLAIAEDVEDGHGLSLRRAFLFFTGHAISPKTTFGVLMAAPGGDCGGLRSRTFHPVSHCMLVVQGLQ
ncbi:MAG: hypothetical protein H7A33_06180 [Deltaproteobacteria bacterium]|nr:hypothetical protein [Deltaproteobacteria bacterium]